MSSAAEHLPSHQPDSMEPGEARRINPDALDPVAVSRTMAQYTGELPHVPDELPQDFLDMDEQLADALQIEKKNGRLRMSGEEWMVSRYGDKWWIPLGIVSDERPDNQLIATAIIKIIDSNAETGILRVIIDEWLKGARTSEIAVMMGMTVGNASSRLNYVKRHLIDKVPKTAEEREAMSSKITKEAGDWLVDVYGAEWWKNFGFEDRESVRIGSVVGEFASKLSLEFDDELRDYLRGWLAGKRQQTMADESAVSLQHVRAQLDKTKSELKALRVKEKQAAKTRARQMGTLANRSNNQQGAIPSPKEQAEKSPSARVSEEWTKRLGMNERMSKELEQYLNPNGGTIMNRDIYLATQKLVGYIQNHFETFDDEKLEDLSEDQRNMLREILGIDRKGDTKRSGMPTRQMVAKFVRDYPQRLYNYRKPQEVAREVTGAFKILLDASAPQEAK